MYTTLIIVGFALFIFTIANTIMLINRGHTLRDISVRMSKIENDIFRWNNRDRLAGYRDVLDEYDTLCQLLVEHKIAEPSPAPVDIRHEEDEEED